MSRLTLFNGRRGGEPARLLMRHLAYRKLLLNKDEPNIEEFTAEEGCMIKQHTNSRGELVLDVMVHLKTMLPAC